MRHKKDLMHLAMVTLIALLLTIAGSASADEAVNPPGVAVKIDNFTFGPSKLVIARGTTVTWTNGDDIPHTIVATDKSFKSRVLDTDETFSYTFDNPGTYAYFCSIHPHMMGEVMVK